MSRSALARRATEARGWLMDACFALWSEKGVGDHGLFHEVLSLDHGPAPQATTRVRVQARQTYVFCQAARMGWKPKRAKKLIKHGVETLTGPGLRPDGLTGKVLASDGGGLIDETADLYDAAFALYALGQAAQVLKDPGAAQAGSVALLGALDQHLKDTRRGGYAEALPPPDTRLQNPHMHLFEACLSQHAADPNGGHMARAGEILGLFLTRFTAGQHGLLGERFQRDWSQPMGDAANIVEPGHQFEWVWLLHTHAGMTDSPQPPEARALYTFGCATLDDAGRACQEVTRDGIIVDGLRRTWPQTEALKAHLAMLEQTHDERHAELACAAFDVLMDEYLTPDGGWIDAYGADGQVTAKDMPASTGYHVVLALAELMRVGGA